MLDLLFPSTQQPPRAKRCPRLPNDLFPLVVRYYWGGGMWAEEEAAVAAEAAAQAEASSGSEEYDYMLGHS